MSPHCIFGEREARQMLKLTTLTIFAFLMFSSLLKGGYINIDTFAGNTEGYQYCIVSVHIFNSAGAIDGVKAIFQYAPRKSTIAECDVNMQLRSRIFAVLNPSKSSIEEGLHTYAPINSDNYELPESLIFAIEQIFEALETNIPINQAYESIERWSITPYDDTGGI